jgi:ubiquinone/menaquinone biosynthesis C-methylase UbiE
VRSLPVMTVNRPWEQEAENWVRWVRRPGHDSYDHFNGAAFFEIVPAPGRATLDVGCGEGRVARDLAARRHKVTGVDASPTMVRFAKEADPDTGYVIADAASLPFDDGSFDLAVAFNSLMDVHDMPGSVREIARVLTPTGRLCAAVTHPINDAGKFVGDEPDAPFALAGSYFSSRRYDETFQRDGLRMTFHGFTHSLGDYARALEQAGFVIEAIREPLPGRALIKDRPTYDRWTRVPLFLHFRAART